MNFKSISFLFFICEISFQFENIKNKTKSLQEKNDLLEIEYKTQKLIISPFDIYPNNEYYKEIELESMNFYPHELKPAIYRINITSLKDHQYYFSKIHYVDAVNNFLNIKCMNKYIK